MIVEVEDHSPLIEVFVLVARTSGGGGRDEEGGGGTERFPHLGWSTFSTKLSLKRKQTSEHGAHCWGLGSESANSLLCQNTSGSLTSF